MTGAAAPGFASGAASGPPPAPQLYSFIDSLPRSCCTPPVAPIVLALAIAIAVAIAVAVARAETQWLSLRMDFSFTLEDDEDAAPPAGIASLFRADEEEANWRAWHRSAR